MQLAKINLGNVIDSNGSSKLTDELVAFLDGIVLIAMKTGRYTYQDISGVQTYKFEGDFYGLLNELGVGKDLHYITMRLNELDSSSDYSSDQRYIRMIDTQFLDVAMSQWRTRKFI